MVMDDGPEERAGAPGPGTGFPVVMTPGDRGVAVWATAAWREAATAWIDERLAAAGSARTGPVEQPRLRSWGTILTVPTASGPVWFKACGRDTSYEVDLYPLLVERTPASVLHPIARDAERGWLLLPDAGPPVLPKGASVDVLLDILRRALPRYAALQRDLAGSVNQMIELGVRDMRPAALPAVFDEVLAATRGFVDRHGTSSDRAAWDRVATLRLRVMEDCARLAVSPVPVSLDHNDLHTGNIGAGEPGSGTFRFYDWGDSGVAHPFTSMLVCLGVLVDYYHVATDDPRLVAVRDAYLEPFTDLAPLPDLVAHLELACRLGRIGRALTWQRVAAALPDIDDSPGEFARDPFRVLSSLLNPSWLGMAGI